jgi:hypothetical protein
MTTLRQIKLSCPIGSNGLISRAKRFNPGSGVGRADRARRTHQTSAHRVTALYGRGVTALVMGSAVVSVATRAEIARQAARDARLDTETVETFYGLTSETVADENRAAHDASVIHADAEDMRTEPAGTAGTRIVCGVVRQ